MKLFSSHKWWWLLLIVATFIVSIITSRYITLTGILASMAGHLAFSIVIATIPWLVYRLSGRPLSTEQMMATITVGWFILAVFNLMEMP